MNEHTTISPISGTKQLATIDTDSFAMMERMAKAVAGSGMFGITKPEQALCLFMICRAEGLDPVTALRRYHLIDGKPAMRADAMQADFLKHGGAIVFHVRTDQVVAATLFADAKTVDDAARERARKRFDLLWALEFEEDERKVSEGVVAVAKLSQEGEETILRTLDDAVEKKIALSWKKAEGSQEGKYVTKTNWKQSPRQMLTARVITEGVRLVMPGIVAGIYTPDELDDARVSPERQIEQLVERSTPSDGDLAAMEKMLAQRVDEAGAATGERRRELQGLAAELRCQIADLKAEARGMTGTVTVEAGPIEAEIISGGNWRDYVLSHIKSKALRGKKLGELSAGEIQVIVEKIPESSDNPEIQNEINMIRLANDELQKEEQA